MKKVFKLIIVIMISVLLISCGSKEKMTATEKIEKYFEIEKDGTENLKFIYLEKDAHQIAGAYGVSDSDDIYITYENLRNEEDGYDSSIFDVTNLRLAFYDEDSSTDKSSLSTTMCMVDLETMSASSLSKTDCDDATLVIAKAHYDSFKDVLNKADITREELIEYINKNIK